MPKGGVYLPLSVIDGIRTSVEVLGSCAFKREALIKLGMFASSYCTRGLRFAVLHLDTETPLESDISERPV